jgi:hypothetical protein
VRKADCGEEGFQFQAVIVSIGLQKFAVKAGVDRLGNRKPTNGPVASTGARVRAVIIAHRTLVGSTVTLC